MSSSPQQIAMTEVDQELWYLLLDQITQIGLESAIYNWLQTSFRPDSHNLFMSYSWVMNSGGSIGAWLDLLYCEYKDGLKLLYTILLEHCGSPGNPSPGNPITPSRIVLLINQSGFYHLFSNHLRCYQTERWGSRHRYATPLEERIVLRQYYSTYEFRDRRYETIFHRATAREEFWSLASLLIVLDDPSSRSEMSSSIIYIQDLKGFNQRMWRYFITLPFTVLIGPTVTSWVTGDDFKSAAKIMSQRHPALEAWMKNRDLVMATDFLAFCDLNRFIKGELVMLFRQRFAPNYSLFDDNTTCNNTTWSNTSNSHATSNNTNWDGLPIFSQELYDLMTISRQTVESSGDMMDLINPDYCDETS